MLVCTPASGPITPETGGRIMVRGDSVRVIYFARAAKGVIWMLAIYAKNEAENIPAHVLRKIRQELGNDED